MLTFNKIHVSLSVGKNFSLIKPLICEVWQVKGTVPPNIYFSYCLGASYVETSPPFNIASPTAVYTQYRLLVDFFQYFQAPTSLSPIFNLKVKMKRQNCYM
jgi:hypothetical protein